MGYYYINEIFNNIWKTYLKTIENDIFKFTNHEARCKAAQIWGILKNRLNNFPPELIPKICYRYINKNNPIFERLLIELCFTNEINNEYYLFLIIHKNGNIFIEQHKITCGYSSPDGLQIDIGELFVDNINHRKSAWEQFEKLLAEYLEISQEL